MEHSQHYLNDGGSGRKVGSSAVGGNGRESSGPPTPKKVGGEIAKLRLVRDGPFDGFFSR
jgi:hypothetical protein